MSRSEYIQAAMNIGKWSEREPWQERLSKVADLHLTPVEESLDINQKDIDEVLGEYRRQVLKAYLLEDFCAFEFGEEKLNAIDAYLEQHGWRESVHGKRYLEALRDSVVSLYEIVKVAPDGAVTAEDRLREGEPVVLEKERVLGDLNQGDYMAGRIVTINGDPWLTNGTLSFSSEVAPLILEAFDQLFEEYTGKYPGSSGPGKGGETIESDGRAVRDSLLSSPGPAAMLSWFWLSHAWDEGIFLESDLEEEEDGAQLSVEVEFPIQAGEGEIAEILNTVEGLEREKDGRFWFWVNPDPPSRDPSQSTNGRSGQPGRGGGRPLGIVDIADGKLLLETDSRETAERGRELLTSHLGDRLGRPRFSTWDPEDLDEAMSAHPTVSPIHPDYGKAILNLGDWVSREPWRKIFYTVLREHLAVVEDFFELDENDIYALLGDHDKQMLNTFILEDFYTTESDEDRHRNIISAYLEKQGPHESVQGRRYLEAARASTASLYEIVEFDPDQGVAVRDMLRGGDPVFVQEDSMLVSLSPGDCLATRLITVDGKPFLTFGQLHIASERVAEILDTLDKFIDSTEKSCKESAGQTEEAEIETDENSVREQVLSSRAPCVVLSKFWLKQTLEKILDFSEKSEGIDDDDFDVLMTFEVHFPLQGEPEEAAAVLDTAKEFERMEDVEFLWDWFGPDLLGQGDPSQGWGPFHGEAKESEVSWLGMVDISGGEVVLEAYVEEDVEQGRDILASLLGDLVGNPWVYSPGRDQDQPGEE